MSQTDIRAHHSELRNTHHNDNYLIQWIAARKTRLGQVRAVYRWSRVQRFGILRSLFRGLRHAKSWTANERRKRNFIRQIMENSK